eukprot:scaffold140158_cov19-Tisochrysis_lutea.AAC.1
MTLSESSCGSPVRPAGKDAASMVTIDLTCDSPVAAAPAAAPGGTNSHAAPAAAAPVNQQTHAPPLPCDQGACEAPAGACKVRQVLKPWDQGVIRVPAQPLHTCMHA